MPTNFYGFQPERKHRGDTARAVGNIGMKAAVAIPEAKRQDDERKYVQEQRRKAAEAIKADTQLASTNWKTFKETYANQARGLIKAGKMTEEELQSDLKMFPMPRRTDLLSVESIGKYLDRFSGQSGELFKKLGTRRKALEEEQKTTGMGTDVQTAVKGSPGEVAQPVPVKGASGEIEFTETDIGPEGKPLVTKPGIPEAKTREDVYKRVEPGTAMDEGAQKLIKETGLPSQFDLDKQKALEDYRKRMAARGYKKDKIDNALDNLEFLEKKRNTDIRAENALDKEKRALTSFANKVRKGDELTPEELFEMEAYGVSGAENLADSEATQDAISRQLRDVDMKIKRQKKKSGDTENAYDLLLDNPNADIHGVLKEGKGSSYEDQPNRGFQPPPALGGLKQIGRGIGDVSKKPQAIQAPQPKKRTPQDEVAIEWAQDKLAQNPNDAVALRILKANGM